MTNKILHVLQVTGTMNRGGAEIMVMDMLRNASPEVRFDFLINTKKQNSKPEGDFDEEILRSGARLKYILSQWDLGIIKYIIEFKKIVNEIGTPDVIHIHLNSRCGVIALAAKLCGIKKIIAHCHGHLIYKRGILKELPKLLELQFQKVLITLFATEFWGCSEVAIKSLFFNKTIKKGKTKIINNAINVRRFQNPANLYIKNIFSHNKLVNTDTFIIGNVGRVVRRKNLSFILDILKYLNDNVTDFLFVYAGRVDDKVYMAEVDNKLKEYQLCDRVIYLGDHTDIPAIMSTFDVFVGPAHNEAFGMVAVEAQAAGLPCILSREYPQSIDMGLQLVTFLDNFDPRQWGDTILAAKGKKCADKDLILTQISARGFDAESNTKRIEKLYQA